jgi:hypothetical protein
MRTDDPRCGLGTWGVSPVAIGDDIDIIDIKNGSAVWVSSPMSTT